MILAPSSSCCFCWNAVSQPSVSPLCDLINECWATRLDPLCGGHIWTLYIEIYICLSLCPSFLLSDAHSKSPQSLFRFLCLFLCLRLPFPLLVFLFLVSVHICLASLSLFLFPSFNLSVFSPFFLSVFVSSSTPLTPPLLRGDQALLSSSLPQEPLTSAGCGAKVVPLSRPTGCGSLCSECLRGEERRGGGKKEKNSYWRSWKKRMFTMIRFNQWMTVNEVHEIQLKALTNY